MKLGTTFSSFHASKLHLPSSDVLSELLNFHFDLIRIGSYWSAYEKVENSFDYSELDHIVSKCQKNNQKIILTVGAKSPRWPEFHIPQWAMDKINHQSKITHPFHSPLENISDEIMRSVKHTVSHFKKYDCIQAWQVENEPLDPSGPNNWTIPLSLLEREIEIVKSIDTRPVIINVWGNTLSERKLLSKIPSSADSIGVDLYYLVPDGNRDRYTAPKDSDVSINQQLQQLKKPVFITELQAEPWENQHHTGDTPSMNPQILEDNIHRVSDHIDAEAIMLWGFEYWYQQKIQGDSALWNTVKNLINK